MAEIKNPLTVSQVAQRIGKSEATIRAYCDRKVLPSVRSGGNKDRLIPADAVEKLANKLERERKQE